ncbi:hypothetical protein ASZ90_019572 [hydrocarbon metagenome]|uniref:Uncharacterized protein n=1 Tax=hydrocarbon metagenome TaxID=938273 RepID=A0A0W8E368_9ZZZZ
MRVLLSVELTDYEFSKIILHVLYRYGSNYLLLLYHAAAEN